MFQRHLILTAASLALALGFVVNTAHAESAPMAKPATTKAALVELKVGEPAPEFELTDVDGKAHKLSSFKGKTVVLEWTNPGCPFVKFHHRQETIKKLADAHKDVVFLSINSTNTGHDEYIAPADFKKIAADKGIPGTGLYDSDGKVGMLYGARTTPHIFIVDKDGKLAYRGAIDENRDMEDNKPTGTYVDEALKSLAKGEAIAQTVTKPYGCSVKYAKKK